MFNSKLTPTEKAERKDAKEKLRAQRRAEAARFQALQEERRAERFEAFPEFVVRETREVTVKAANMQDAISLASVAFKHGQDDDDHTIDSYNRPWHTEGDTIDAIRTVSIKAVEQDD